MVNISKSEIRKLSQLDIDSALNMDEQDINVKDLYVHHLYFTGYHWIIRVSAADNNWRSVAYGNGLFVAVAYSGTGNRVMTSPDGINWTIRVSAADNDWYSVTYGNGLFVAVANNGTGDRVMTSGILNM